MTRHNRLGYLKGNIELLGLGHIYHDAWWRRASRRRSPLTDWNYRNETIFVHIPKTAGLSIYDMFDMERSYDTHAPVAGYRVADPELFSRAYKFAVVRNPWDRLLSGFQYLKQTSRPQGEIRWLQDEAWSEQYLCGIDTFPDFLGALRSPKFRRLVLTWRHFIPQHYFITARGSGLLVDRLVRFEAIDQGLADVAARLGMTLRSVRRNVSSRAAYQGYYTDADIRFVADLYARDIAVLGYRFDE